MEATWTRTLPAITELNRPFWTAGESGTLLIARCSACRRWADPPKDSCTECEGTMAFEPVSGRGRLYTYTVNRHPYHPDVPPPTIIAIVQLDEQDDLRIVTNIVDCDPADLVCQMPVEVRFEPQGDYFYPVFVPAGR